MDLFELRNGRAFPSIHALLIEPYKTMWNNDDSPDHEFCIMLFTYIELLCSPKKSNPFWGYSEDDRPAKVKKELFGSETYTLKTDLTMAIQKYKELLDNCSPAYDLCISAENAAAKLKKYLNEFNFNSRTAGGAMLIKPGEITRALREIPDVIKSMTVTRENLNSALLEEGKTRSDRNIGLFER